MTTLSKFLPKFDFSDMDAAFRNALILATLLHLAGITWVTLPERRPYKPPEITTLNLKIGQDPKMLAPAPSRRGEETNHNNNKRDRIPLTPVKDQPPQEDSQVPRKPPVIREPRLSQPAEKGAQPPVQAIAPVMRPQLASMPKKPGSFLGNSTAKEAEPIKRYEQLLGAWFQNNKLYPEEARNNNIQGDAVVRIKINRVGIILQASFERRTGHPILDDAITQMIAKANPVPKVPSDYPEQGTLEFLIPISFHLY